MEELSWFFDVDDLGDDLAEIIGAGDIALIANNNPLLANQPEHESQIFFSELLEDIGDWFNDEPPIVANYLQPTPPFFDEWQWDDVTPPEFVVLGYQQADYYPPRPQDESYSWDEFAEDDWQEESQPVGADNNKLLCLQDAWDFEEQIDDEWGVGEGPTQTFVIQPAPFDDAWDWDEHAASDLVITGYMQADNAPAKPVDADWDFDESVEDEWQDLTDDTDDAVSTDSNPILSNQEWLDFDELADDEWAIDEFIQSAYAAPISDFEWDWTEVLPSEFTVLGYQNSDFVQPAPPRDDAWDWDECAPSDLVITGYQNSDSAVVANATQQPQDDWDFASDFGGEDGWSNHFTNYDAPTVYDTEWDWDECVFGEWMPLGYQQADAAQVATPVQTFGQEWDFDESVEDEWQDLTDDTDDAVGPNAPVNPLLCVSHEWDWDELADDDIAPDEFRSSNAAIVPQQPPDDSFDWSEDAEDDWLTEFASGPVGANGLVILAQTFDDIWLDDDLDDEWTVDENQQVAIVAAVAQPADDAYDWDESADDEWFSDDVLQAIAISQTFDDPWDWEESADDDWTPDESQQVTQPAQADDAWWVDDQGDDEWQEESAPVASGSTAFPVDDAWTHFEDLCEDDWQEESALVGISYLQPTPPLDDAWDWDEWCDDESLLMTDAFAFADATFSNNEFPLAGLIQPYPLSGLSQQYPLAGLTQQYPLAGLIQT